MDQLWIFDGVELTDEHRDRPESILLHLEGAFESEGRWGTVVVNVVGDERADVDADQAQQWGAVVERCDDLLASAAELVASETGRSVEGLDLGEPRLIFWSTVEATDPVEWGVHFQECSAYPEAGVIVLFAGDTPTGLFDPIDGEDLEWD